MVESVRSALSRTWTALHRTADANALASAPLLLGALLLIGMGVGVPGRAAPPQLPSPGADTVPSFSHDVHEAIQCTACHQMDAVHGASTVQTLQDCRSCHHTDEARRSCTACHQEGDEEWDRTYRMPRTFDLTVDVEDELREVSFRHPPHRDLACARCHDDGPSLSVPELDCQSCHEDHHVQASDCWSCHVEPEVGEEAHDRSVHVTCAGSGCHQDAPFQGPLLQRDGCLACHQEQVDHQEGRECARCHLMPPASFDEWSFP